MHHPRRRRGGQRHHQGAGRGIVLRRPPGSGPATPASSQSSSAPASSYPSANFPPCPIRPSSSSARSRTRTRPPSTRVRARGCEPVVLDAQRFPEDLRSRWARRPRRVVIEGPADRSARGGRTCAASTRARPPTASTPTRHDEGGLAPHDPGVPRALDLLSAILPRWEAHGAAFYNPSSSAPQHHQAVPAALLQAAEPAGAGHRCGATTRRPCARFCSDVTRSVVYKPVAGGARDAARSRRRTCADERLDKLRAAPVCFKELLPGDDVRVYVIDGRVVCALRIVTDAIDFRQHEQRIEAHRARRRGRAQGACARPRVIGLRYTGMDIKADRHGRYKILELNPSAMFLGFEQRAGRRHPRAAVRRSRRSSGPERPARGGHR